MVSPFRWQSFCNFVGTRLMFISRSQLMHACFTSLQELRINLNWTFFQAKMSFITQGEGLGNFRQWKAVLTLGLPLQIKKWSITQFKIYLFSDNTRGCSSCLCLQSARLFSFNTVAQTVALSIRKTFRAASCLFRTSVFDFSTFFII